MRSSTVPSREPATRLHTDTHTHPLLHLPLSTLYYMVPLVVVIVVLVQHLLHLTLVSILPPRHPPLPPPLIHPPLSSLLFLLRRLYLFLYLRLSKIWLSFYFLSGFTSPCLPFVTDHCLTTSPCLIRSSSDLSPSLSPLSLSPSILIPSRGYFQTWADE